MDKPKIDIYLVTQDNPSKSLLNKLNLLSTYLKSLSIDANVYNKHWNSSSDEDKQDKIFKDLKYLPSWIIVKNEDICILDGDHLIKALKTQILKFIKG